MIWHTHKTKPINGAIIQDSNYNVYLRFTSTSGRRHHYEITLQLAHEFKYHFCLTTTFKTFTNVTYTSWFWLSVHLAVSARAVRVVTVLPAIIKEFCHNLWAIWNSWQGLCFLLSVATASGIESGRQNVAYFPEISPFHDMGAHGGDRGMGLRGTWTLQLEKWRHDRAFGAAKIVEKYMMICVILVLPHFGKFSDCVVLRREQIVWTKIIRTIKHTFYSLLRKFSNNRLISTHVETVHYYEECNEPQRTLFTCYRNQIRSLKEGRRQAFLQGRVSTGQEGVGSSLIFGRFNGQVNHFATPGTIGCLHLWLEQSYIEF